MSERAVTVEQKRLYNEIADTLDFKDCPSYTSPSPRDATLSRMPFSVRKQKN